jgi:transcription termination factor Rho
MASSFSGILETDQQKFGFVRAMSIVIDRSDPDPYVPASLIDRHRLRPRVVLEGTATLKKVKSPEVIPVERVNGLTFDAWAAVRDFSSHEAVTPSDIIRLEGPGTDRSTQVVDLFCPVGKGRCATGLDRSKEPDSSARGRSTSATAIRENT